MKYWVSIILCNLGIGLTGWFLMLQWSMYVNLQDRKLHCEIERLAWDFSAFDKNTEETFIQPIKINFLCLNAYPQLYYDKQIQISGYIHVTRNHGKELLFTSRGRQQNVILISISKHFPFNDQFVELNGCFKFAYGHQFLLLDTATSVLDKEISRKYIEIEDRSDTKGDKR